MSYPQYPCRNCVYSNACGDNTRTAFCAGRMTKTQKKAGIRNGSFVSVWDGGVEIDTPCKVNMKTKEVFNIATSHYNGDILEKEYIVVDDKEYPVFQIGEITAGGDEFWYDA